MVYFTSDLHLGHSGIISMQNRPFSSVAEMNRVILTNYNAVVHKNDTVYILGDICHHMKIESANELIGQMNGKKILVLGNHDKKYDESLFQEFFLPKDGPGFCVGCNTCFLKGEEYCSGAGKVQPIIKAMKVADLIILDSPNYVIEMSGAMKNLMDHLAYRWVTHRPSGNMFMKTGITICSSAGAPCKHTTHSMAKQLKWMDISKVYEFPLISNAMGVSDLSEKKKMEIQNKAKKIARKASEKAVHSHASLRGKLLFSVFRKMQMSPDASWNPTDRDWWVTQGWTKEVRPWKS